MSTLRHDWTASNQTECYRCGTAWRPEVDNEQCSGWKAPPPPPLTFERLRAVNVLRCEDAFHKLNAWLPEQWTNAMAGETGEACNITKKMGRGDYPDEYSMADATRELAKELADVVIYADLAAARLGIDLGEAVRQKFNEVSDRRKSKIKL